MTKAKWNKPSHLHTCPKCNDKSVVREIYNTQYQKKRAEWCINKGCGYKQALPFPEEYKREEVN